MSEGSEVSKVTLCVKILKWQSLTHSVTHSVTKVRYRAARAAKNWNPVVPHMIGAKRLKKFLKSENELKKIIFLAALAALYLTLVSD